MLMEPFRPRAFSPRIGLGIAFGRKKLARWNTIQLSIGEVLRVRVNQNIRLLANSHGPLRQDEDEDEDEEDVFGHNREPM